MTRQLDSIILDSLSNDIVHAFFAVEMLFDGEETLRLWTGYGTLVYEGNSYYGTGQLLSLSEFAESSEIAAKGATISLSGVSPEIVNLALSEPYQGRRANIYFGTLQKGGLLLQENGAYILLEDGSRILLDSNKTALTQIFAGYMDTMPIEEGSEGSYIELSIESKFIDLERVRPCRYSSAYQKTKYPEDKGFDFVELLQDREIKWGST